MMITKETRKEAHETVDKQKRRQQIIEILSDSDGMTAKEVSVIMYRKGLIPTSERNFAAPRLTELAEQGIVKVVGKKRCRYTNKTVAVYCLAV